MLEARRKGVVGLGIFASWRKVSYGVSFAAAAISASSESELRGVIRGGRVEEALLVCALAPDRFVAMTAVQKRLYISYWPRWKGVCDVIE